MPAGIKEVLETPVLNAQSVYCDEETRKRTQLVWREVAAIVSADPSVAPDVVTLTLMENMRKC
jgi:hypothetical protein